MELEIGQIVRLEIIHHFEKKRYYLVYRKTDTDYILLNITSKYKTSKSEDEENGINPGYQHKLSIRIDPKYISVINLNTLVIIEHKLFSDLFINLVEQDESKISKEEFEELIIKLRNCFANESFKSNLYRVRVLPDNDKKTLMIISS